jgi:hypothetical protein
MEAVNTAAAPDTVAPRPHGEVHMDNDGRLRARLKPGSWNVFVIEGSGFPGG